MDRDPIVLPRVVSFTNTSERKSIYAKDFKLTGTVNTAASYLCTKTVVITKKL